MVTQQPLHVLIAGGGLSGLCLAQGLLKDGHTCEVFERDADLSRKRGYYLHMNADGGEALRRCLPGDLFELYAETSRQTPDRRESIVLDDQLNVLSSQPHLGPPNEGPRPHTGVHRRTLRQILLARLGESFRPGRTAVSYEEQPDGVRLKLDDGSTAEGDVLVGADGIRSAIRGQRLPGVPVIDAGIRGLGVYGRSPLTPGLRENLPSLLLQGVIIAADRRGSRMLLAAFQPRRPAAEAAAELAPDVTLEPVEDYLMVSCSVAPGTVIPPAGGWTGETPALLREPEPGRVLTESDTGSSSVTTFTVSPQGGASLVQISTTWDGAHGIGGYFERMFAPRVMRAIYLDELSRLAAYAREHRSA